MILFQDAKKKKKKKKKENMQFMRENMLHHCSILQLHSCT